MKSKISVTLEKELLEQVDCYGKEKQRSRSQVIEIALEHFLRDRMASGEEIVTSASRFTGNFSREETYER